MAFAKSMVASICFLGTTAGLASGQCKQACPETQVANTPRITLASHQPLLADKDIVEIVIAAGSFKTLAAAAAESPEPLPADVRSNLLAVAGRFTNATDAVTEKQFPTPSATRELPPAPIAFPQ